MSDRIDFARVMIPVFVIMAAILMNNTRIVRIETPFNAYQIQLLGKSLIVCPNSYGRDPECRRWLGYFSQSSSV